MASIQVELNTIKNDPDGQDVLNAIASASEKINQNEFDITQELEIIRNPVNRYGIDIRMAIHDALEKLSEKEGGGGDGSGFFCSSNVIAVSKGLILPMDIVSAELPPRPPAPFTCDSEYFIDSPITWEIGSGTYHKSTNEYAVGMIISIVSGGSWTAPILLSPIDSVTAVQYVCNDYTAGRDGSITYEGVTWWYSFPYGQSDAWALPYTVLPKYTDETDMQLPLTTTQISNLLTSANVHMTS